MSWLIERITFWRVVAGAILMAGAVATFQRFYYGLGYATNLSDSTPWGLWIGFDVVSGVGLAAGGFTLTAVTYIFNLKEYHCIVKPAVLTAFLGYMLVAFALIWDLGKPFDIWHPLVYGNPRSPMFELAVCVTTYTLVLGLEFSSFALEKFRWLKRPLGLLKKVYIPLVILGVLISTLHQSSLGTLFIIVPQKLHPLWYSELLPIYFFVTSIGAGMAMTIVESYLSYRGMGHEAPPHILGNLARGMVVIQVTFTVALFEGFVVAGKLGYLVDGSFESMMFWLETLLWTVIPTIIVLNRKLIVKRIGITIAGFSCVLGFLLNRLNVSITALEYTSESGYMPSWQEVAVSISLVIIAFGVFKYAIRYFGLFQDDTEQKAEKIHLNEAA